jgi:hypothetical protein
MPPFVPTCRPHRLQPITQLSGVLLHAILHDLGPVPDFVKVAVRLSHHRLAAAAAVTAARHDRASAAAPHSRYGGTPST